MAKWKPMKRATVKPATGPREIDYTTMRPGDIVRQWTYRDKDGKAAMGCTRIALCPKCGRPGEETIYRDRKTLAETSRTYTHKSEINEMIPGFPLCVVKDQCAVPVVPAQPNE